MWRKRNFEHVICIGFALTVLNRLMRWDFRQYNYIPVLDVQEPNIILKQTYLAKNILPTL